VLRRRFEVSALKIRIRHSITQVDRWRRGETGSSVAVPNGASGGIRDGLQA